MFDSFTFQSNTFDCVPEGNYQAEYVGNEEITSKFSEDGKAIAWRFKVVDGPNTGKVVSLVSGRTPTAKNKCGKTISSLIGKTPNVGDSVTIKDFIGKRYLVVVKKNDNGDGTKIDTVVKL